MEVTNENSEETPLLTHGDLAIAAYAISQCFNAYLESYEAEEYVNDMSKEQMESSMNSLQMSFTKFDAIVKTLQIQAENEDNVEATDTSEE
jgi:hypothetical protein